MAKITKKAKIEPVREANELAVENVVEKKEEKKEIWIKEAVSCVTAFLVQESIFRNNSRKVTISWILRENLCFFTLKR